MGLADRFRDQRRCWPRSSRRQTRDPGFAIPPRPDLNTLNPQRPHPAQPDRPAPRADSGPAPDAEAAPTIDARRFAAHVRARAAADEKIRARQFRNEIRDRKRILAWVAGILVLAAGLFLAAIYR